MIGLQHSQNTSDIIISRPAANAPVDAAWGKGATGGLPLRGFCSQGLRCTKNFEGERSVLFNHTLSACFSTIVDGVKWQL